MEKIEILKYFLKEGIQLTPEALDFIINNQDTIDKIINYTKQKNLLLIDERVLLEIEELNKTQEIKILYPEEISSFSIEDVLRMYKERFEFLSRVIQENHLISNLTSIHKAKKMRNGESVTLIGMVKDKTNYTILLEDSTSYETIQLDPTVVNELFFDDVIGILVKKEEEKYIGDKILLPSLSFFRVSKDIKNDIIISNLDNLEIKFNNKLISLQPKEIIRVYVYNLRIFLVDFKIIEYYRKGNKNELDVLISLIERRHLNPSFFICKKIYKKDFYLLDEIPDFIVILNSKEAIYKAYKGINIFFLPKYKKVSLKEKKFY
jgi:DNA polymerase II small subunit/DNA polymerase delta subunit B